MVQYFGVFLYHLELFLIRQWRIVLFSCKAVCNLLQTFNISFADCNSCCFSGNFTGEFYSAFPKLISNFSSNIGIILSVSLFAECICTEYFRLFVYQFCQNFFLCCFQKTVLQLHCFQVISLILRFFVFRTVLLEFFHYHIFHFVCLKIDGCQMFV